VPPPLQQDVLEIPSVPDPNKTQVVSEAELRAEMAKHSAENEVVEVPPAAEPEPPEFEAPEPEPPPMIEMAEATPPPSPFSTPSEPERAVEENRGPASFPTTPPIPSPFGSQKPSEPEAEQARVSQVDEPKPAFDAFSPQAAAPIEQSSSTKPSTIEPVMQNPQNFGQSAPAPAGQNKTLAIVSLILGILGLTLCCGTFVPSLVAVITGFMARGKANNNPAQYGGAGLALGGLITGVLGLLGSVIVAIYVALNFAVIMASMPR